MLVDLVTVNGTVNVISWSVLKRGDHAVLHVTPCTLRRRLKKLFSFTFVVFARLVVFPQIVGSNWLLPDSHLGDSTNPHFLWVAFDAVA